MTDVGNRKTLDRISPLWLGVGISGSLLVLLLVTETLLGRWAALQIDGEFDPLVRSPTGVLRDLRLAIVHCLLAGYLPAALLRVVQSGRRHVLKLQTALGCTREECEALSASIRLGTRGLVITGMIGFLFAAAGPYMVEPVPDTPWLPSSWSPEVAWHRVIGPVVGILTWWLGYAIVSVSTRMSRLARKLSHIDVFDLSALAPFTRQGLTNALLILGLIAIWSLMMLESGFGLMMLMYGGSALVVTAFALLQPVRGVHQRIRQAKEAELSWVNGEIASWRRSLQSSETDQHRRGMADLVAYRGLIESAPDWPFTTSTYARLILYMLIPVLSWGLGIFAEEIVSRVLF
jgi:hypothetical protein